MTSCCSLCEVCGLFGFVQHPFYGRWCVSVAVLGIYLVPRVSIIIVVVYLVVCVSVAVLGIYLVLRIPNIIVVVYLVPHVAIVIVAVYWFRLYPPLTLWSTWFPVYPPLQLGFLCIHPYRCGLLGFLCIHRYRCGLLVSCVSTVNVVISVLGFPCIHRYYHYHTLTTDNNALISSYADDRYHGCYIINRLLITMASYQALTTEISAVISCTDYR